MNKVSDQIQNDKGISDELETNNETQEEQTDDSVQYDTFQRVLRQKKSADEKIAKYEKQLNEIKMREEAEKAEKLKQQQKFEEYSKQLEEKLESERKEKEDYRKSLLDTHKLQAVLDKLPAKPKRSEYLNFINLEQVEIDPETGIVSESVEQVANDFISNYGELLDRQGKGLPNDAPRTTSKLTYEQWLKLPTKEKKLRMKEVFDAE